MIHVGISLTTTTLKTNMTTENPIFKYKIYLQMVDFPMSFVSFQGVKTAFPSSKKMTAFIPIPSSWSHGPRSLKILEVPGRLKLQGKGFPR